MAALAAIALVLPPAPAEGDARSERQEVRRRQAEVAGQLDVLRAEDAEVTQALDALDANVAGQEGLLADAQRQVAAAEQALAEARAAEAETQARISVLQEDLQALAIDSFMGGGPTSGVEAVFGATDPVTATRNDTILGMIAGDANDLADQLHAAEEDLIAARQQAEVATTQAQERQQEEARQLAEVQAARDQAAAFAAELDGRIESRLAESAALAQTDARLASQIAQQEAELAARAARARASAPSSSRSTVSRGSSGGGASVGSLSTVRGITVASSIADNLASLLDAAAADGHSFGGGGYRDPSDQQRLRDQNCPSGDASPSSCHPPTARPGHSMHEQGLAVDFTYEGGLIQSRSNPGYRWLAANAASYGFYNLPSEPWHWSVNGN